jgi:hypothetical protein
VVTVQTVRVTTAGVDRPAEVRAIQIGSRCRRRKKLTAVNRRFLLPDNGRWLVVTRIEIPSSFSNFVSSLVESFTIVLPVAIG